MAMFYKNSQGGIMDVIRCDQTGYLVWKWHPTGSVEGESVRENAIRWGSSLRVKSGEVAVFVNHNNGKLIQDYILGPYDAMLKTENLPVISSAANLAYNGYSPFQAEVYFINVAQLLQVKIGVPYFDVADPRYPDRGVPTAVRGVMNFKIGSVDDFITKYQLRTVTIDEFKGLVKAATTKYVKNVVANAPDKYGIPVTQLEKRILEINEIIEQYLRKRLLDEFGTMVTSVDISDIEIDKTSANYKFLLKKSDVDINLGVASKIRGFVADTANETIGVMAGAAAQAAELQTDKEIAAIDVKEYQYAKHKKAQIGFIRGLFKGDGDLSAAETRPSFTSNLSKGINGFFTGIGSRFSKKADGQTPPPIPVIEYYVAVEGEAVGPLDYDGLTEYIRQGKLSPDSLVWKKGIESWVEAKTMEDLKPLFTKNETESLPPITQVSNKNKV